MSKIPIPINENERIAELGNYGLLDMFPEEAYDNIIQIAAYVCNTSAAFISLVDTKQQVFKVKKGFDDNGTNRENSICTYTILNSQEIFIVEDIRKDKRFKDKLINTGLENLVFYAGIPVLSSNGYALGTLCVMDTQVKKLSDEQINILKHLSKQVTFLFELKRKSKELEESTSRNKILNKEMEDFVYAATHDLKEPVRMVSSFMKFLNQKYAAQLDETANKYIYYAMDGANRMNALINDLLEFYKAGKVDEEYENINIEEIVLEIQKLHETGNISTNAKIEFINIPSLINLPKNTLKQVMQNLICNATKYCHSNKRPVVKINITENNTHYTFEISDNGIGIPENQLEKIFNPFVRLHRKEEYSGTGMGLAICKKNIEKYNGNIWATSKIGEGSTFYFTFAKR